MRTYLREFDVDTARKIISNEIKGKIVTRNGYKVNIVYWNYRNITNKPIVAIIDYGDVDKIETYKEDGSFSQYNKEDDLDVMLEIEVIQNDKFTDGNIVITEDREVIAIYNGRYVPNIGELPYYVALENDVLHFQNVATDKNSGYGNINNYRRATEKEKEELYNKLEDNKENELAQLYLELFFRDNSVLNNMMNKSSET